MTHSGGRIRSGGVLPRQFRHVSCGSDHPSVTTPTEPTKTAEVLLDDWQAEMRAANLSERTIAAWRAIVERTARRIGIDVLGLTTTNLSYHLAGYRNGNTRRTYYIALNAWSTWLVDRGHRADNPCSVLRRPRAPKGVPHPVSTPALQRLLASPMPHRTRAMVLLGAYQGLRVHEIAKVRGTDVDSESGVLHVVGKGGVIADLPLHPEIADLALNMPSEGWWFVSAMAPGEPIASRTVTTHITTAMRRAGVAGVPHALRHWYATALLRAGTDVRTVQTLMRHASLVTTQAYLEVVDEQRRAAVLRLPAFSAVAS